MKEFHKYLFVQFKKKPYEYILWNYRLFEQIERHQIIVFNVLKKQ